MNKRTKGFLYEKQACAFLEEQGYRVVACNFRNRFGEIDVIAKEQEYLCFVEVKYRQDNGCGVGMEAVDRRKIRTITKVAQYYLVTQGFSMDTPVRFDVVSIDGNHMQLLRNAFEAM